MSESVTQLLGLGLTPGKLRGLNRISNNNGTFTMLALDQNNSMIKMAREALQKSGDEREPTYDEIVEAKLELTREMCGHASAVLLDAVYGSWNAVASHSLPADKGLLVRVEKSGAQTNSKGGIQGEVEPGWSVAQIKKMGADAVKLLAQYEPSEPQSAEHQFALAQKVSAACKEHDILFLLEPTSYPLEGETKESDSYLNRKAQTVIDSAHHLSRLCDVYKAEFPGTLDHESDEKLQENLNSLNKASLAPWVLLSAGVDYPQYQKQVAMAVTAGASGVLGGRAFWKEYFLQDTLPLRRDFAAGEASERLSEVNDMVQQKAKPWYGHYGLDHNDLKRLRAAEGWFHHYGAREPMASNRQYQKDLTGDY